MILFIEVNLYKIHKEIKRMDDFKFVINKGVRIVDDKEMFTITVSEVRDAESLRRALEVVWDEIFGRKYSSWIDVNGYVPYGFEDREDLERVLQEEPETFLDMLYPYPGEWFVDRIYQNGRLIYSYDD